MGNPLEDISISNHTPSNVNQRTTFNTTNGVHSRYRGAAHPAPAMTREQRSAGRGPTVQTGNPNAHFPGRSSDYKGKTVVGGPENLPVNQPEKPPYGTESGPGILENWFNQRANGVDAAYDYAMKRGMEKLGNSSAAAGSFNSGAARQQESDFAANMGAQRMASLDALAGGASGEHQGRLNAMFNQGLGLAGGMAGTSGAYDLKAADSLNAANQAILSMFLGKAGVDGKANQQGLNNLFSLGGLFA